MQYLLLNLYVQLNFWKLDYKRRDFEQVLCSFRSKFISITFSNFTVNYKLWQKNQIHCCVIRVYNTALGSFCNFLFVSMEKILGLCRSHWKSLPLTTRSDWKTSCPIEYWVDFVKFCVCLYGKDRLSWKLI